MAVANFGGIGMKVTMAQAMSPISAMTSMMAMIDMISPLISKNYSEPAAPNRTNYAAQAHPLSVQLPAPPS